MNRLLDLLATLFMWASIAAAALMVLIAVGGMAAGGQAEQAGAGFSFMGGEPRAGDR